jgi:hypothetical protein
MIKNNTTKLALIGIIIIFIFSAINALFYSIGYAFSFKTGTYIITGDYLADLFKIALSYPKLRGLVESGQVTFPPFLAPLLNVYYKYVAYHGVDGLSVGQLTHFHLPPLTTGFTLLSISAFAYFGFIYTPLLLVMSVIGLLFYATTKICARRLDGFLLFGAVIISYPFIFFLQRGNFLAFYAFIFTVIAVIGLARNIQVMPVVLMAIAVNIRPNLAVFVPLFYFLPNRNLARPLAVLFLVLFIFIGSAYLVNQSYPDYTLENFLRGLQIYKEMYVIGDWGFGYSISLYTLLKLISKLFTATADFNLIILILGIGGVISLTYVYTLYGLRLIQKESLLFLLAAISMLFTPVFADYHLLIFALPAMFAVAKVADNDNKQEYVWNGNGVMFVACCIMLSPLNYIGYEGLYAAAMLKIPLVLVISYILVNRKPI